MARLPSRNARDQGRALTSEQFASRPIPGSATSLLGLVRHLTEIERTYFRRVFGGQEVPDLPFGTDPFGEESETDFASTAAAPPEEALATRRAEVEASRQVIADAACLDDRGASALPLRFWLVKTMNEYARHSGHAAIIRELIDGTTGE
jgi:Protein of unknown function (DUF664)